MNVKTETSLIIGYHSRGEKQKIREKLNIFTTEKMKLDKFMSMFLEKFERKMNWEDLDTPIWNLYRKKSDEYSKVSQLIKVATYYSTKP